MPKHTGSNYHNDRYRTPLWLQLLLHATRFVVFIQSHLRESRERVGREPFRRLALYRLLSNQPNRLDEDEQELIQIVCAACKSMIGIVSNNLDVQEVAEELAEQHYDYFCTATEEEKQQALYDMKFRDLIKELGL